MLNAVLSNVELASQAGPSSRKAIAADMPSYQRPRLMRVGSVTRLVQSGPVGNRYETYRCSYWSDR